MPAGEELVGQGYLVDYERRGYSGAHMLPKLAESGARAGSALAPVDWSDKLLCKTQRWRGKTHEPGRTPCKPRR